MKVDFLDQNTQAARVFYKMVSSFSNNVKSWEKAIFYEIKPDELLDVTLISRRIYGRPDEYLAVMAVIALDSFDMQLEQKTVAFPNEAQLMFFKRKSGYESQANLRHNGRPTWLSE